MKKCFLSLSLLVAMGGALSTMSVVSSCSDDKVNYLKKEEQGKEEEEKEEVKYRVTFDSRGGSNVSSQEVKKGGLVEKPEDPTKGESVFVGWFKEKTCTTQWDFATDEVNQDLTLYAGWGGQWAIDPNTKKLAHSLSEVENAQDDATKIVFETGLSNSEWETKYDGGDEMGTAIKAKIIDDTVLYVGTTEDFICLSDTLIYNYFGFFDGFIEVTEIENIGVLRTDNVTSMKDMFLNCTNLKILDLSNFNTEKVTNMEDMFDMCNKLETLDISNFNTKNVKNMSGMFSLCEKLTTLDLSNFNTENVTSMGGMFNVCTKMNRLVLGENFVIPDDYEDYEDMLSGFGSSVASPVVPTIVAKKAETKNKLEEMKNNSEISDNVTITEN